MLKFYWSEFSELETNGEFAKTKKAALANSIRKHETIVRFIEGVGQVPQDTGGTGTCNLCFVYYGGVLSRCHGCPVSQATGRLECLETPYHKIDKLYDELPENPQPKSFVARFLALEKLEVEFLKSLSEDTEK